MSNLNTEVTELQSSIELMVQDGVHKEGDKWVITVNGNERAETNISLERAEEIYEKVLEYEEAIPFHLDGKFYTYVFRIQRPGFTVIADGGGEISYSCNHCEGPLDAPIYKCRFCRAI